MRLIAIDMDGTLINSRNEISKEYVEAIREAQRKGVKIAITTGRIYYDAQQLLEEVGLPCPIISGNGAYVCLETGEKIFSQPLNRSDAIDTLKALDEKRFYREIFTNRAIYSTENGEEKLARELEIGELLAT